MARIKTRKSLPKVRPKTVKRIAPEGRQKPKAIRESAPEVAIRRPQPAEPVTPPYRARAKAAAGTKEKVAGPESFSNETFAIVAQAPQNLEMDVASEALDATAQDKPRAGQKPDPNQPAGPGTMKMADFEALSRNMARLVEEGGKALAAYIKPMEIGRAKPGFPDEVGDAVKTFGKIAEHWLSDPKRTLRAQTAFSTNFLDLWATTLRRFSGDAAASSAKEEALDKRFADPAWRQSPVFDFIRQAYSITTNWANDLVKNAEGLDPHTRDKAEFYLRQISGALSPSNFIITNPELLRETFKENGENLVRGMQMLAEDIEAGKGTLRIRQSDPTKFQLGVDMAATPGKVIYRNDLIELIQYAPTTQTVYKRPVLVVPPWINKFYILDLNPEKSFVRWAVAEGLTVFVISWVNPDERHANKSFEDYMREGIFAALDAIEAATGEKSVAAIGYCVGGTLLAAALAYMAAMNDRRIESATFFAAQVDFRHAGDLKIFVDEAQVRAIEAKMRETGYLDGAEMANAFNMLRPNDLIWSYVVNNYLKGKAPMPFDLLTWNSDSTRMPAANHSFYLRNCYLENKLSRGEMVIGQVKLDLNKVTAPIYNLATREDHIAPAQSVFQGSQCFGGPVRYVLAGSGHIAGVVNPVSKPKYQYWTGPQPEGEFENWLKNATEHTGTWWPDWIQWLTEQAPAKVQARSPGEGKLKPICDAPGTYVRVRS